MKFNSMKYILEYELRTKHLNVVSSFLTDVTCYSHFFITSHSYIYIIKFYIEIMLQTPLKRIKK